MPVARHLLVASLSLFAAAAGAAQTNYAWVGTYNPNGEGLYRFTVDAETGALDGYACIVTSELGLKAPEVFHLYRELWRLAEPFQVLESDFSPSPYPTPRDEHMRAHFAICYAAFFAMRLMRSDLHWRFNAAQVADALIRMEGGHLAENWFLFGYRSPVSDAIEQAAGGDAARRLRTRQDIREGIARARRHIRCEQAGPDM